MGLARVVSHLDLVPHEVSDLRFDPSWHAFCQVELRAQLVLKRTMFGMPFAFWYFPELGHTLGWKLLAIIIIKPHVSHLALVPHEVSGLRFDLS